MRALVCAWTLASCVVAAGVQAAAIRAFSIRYRLVRDVAVVVGPLLSPDGSMTIQPQFNLLTVRDSAAVIERVAKAVEAWDVPPPSYRVGIRLLLGTTVPATPGPTPLVTGGVGAELMKVFHFTSYKEIETVQVTATEGTVVEAEAGGRYHLRFGVRAAANDPDRIQLGQFEVTRREPTSPGNETLRPLLRTTVSLEIGQTAIVGLARSEGASQGLVLVLWAEREPKQ